VTDTPDPRAGNILVVKLGALGDFVLALGPAEAIRRHHPNARITVLTTKPFESLARACPFFDDVWIDTRPSPIRSPLAVLRLRRRLIEGRFTRVYDLQTSDRSSFYHRLMGLGNRPEWSGIALGSSHPHDNPRRDFMHTIDRQKDQLAYAGITTVPAPNLAWLTGDIAGFGLDDRVFVLLVPGGSAHRPEKRWPAASYGALAREIAAAGMVPVILGGPGERDLAAEIRAAAPAALDLAGRTDFGQIAALARLAKHAVGNDTGPMHLVAAAGCPSTVLFSAASDPDLTRPVGGSVIVFRRQRLADLLPREVAATLELS
jgi:ADP-heptose:LPS heptosyltransferase